MEQVFPITTSFELMKSYATTIAKHEADGELDALEILWQTFNEAVADCSITARPSRVTYHLLLELTKGAIDRLIHKEYHRARQEFKPLAEEAKELSEPSK